MGGENTCAGGVCALKLAQKYEHISSLRYDRVFISKKDTLGGKNTKERKESKMCELCEGRGGAATRTCLYRWASPPSSKPPLTNARRSRNDEHLVHADATLEIENALSSALGCSAMYP